MAKKDKENKNILFVSIFIGTMFLFMIGTVIYVTKQVAGCSSVKKARKLCYFENREDYQGVKADKLPRILKS